MDPDTEKLLADLHRAGKRVWEAIDTIERHMRNLRGRDEFIVKKGLWSDFVDQLPQGRAYLGTSGGEFERGKDVGRAIGWDAAKRDTSKSLGTDQ